MLRTPSIIRFYHTIFRDVTQEKVISRIVPVRTIQQYEQRQKNINKAQAEYLVVLAKVLCCEAGDLMEKIE